MKIFRLSFLFMAFACLPLQAAIANLHSDSTYVHLEKPWNARSRYIGNGKLAYAHGNDVALFDFQTGRVWRYLRGHQDSIYALEVFKRGEKTYIVSGDSYGDHAKFIVWDADTASSVAQMEEDGGTLCALAFEQDGKTYLATSGWREEINIWDTETWKVVKALRGHENTVYALSTFTRDGSTFLVSGSWDHSVRIWNTKTGKVQRTFKGHGNGMIRFVQAIKEGQDFLIASNEQINDDPENAGNLLIWSEKTGKVVHNLRLPQLQEARPFIYQQNGKSYVLAGEALEAGDEDNSEDVSRLNVYDMKTGSVVQTFSELGFVGDPYAFKENDTTYIFAPSDKKILLWDANKGPETARFYSWNMHESSVRSVHVFRGPDQKIYLVSGSWDRTVRIWNVETGLSLHLLEGHTGGVTYVYARANVNGTVQIESYSKNEILTWKWDTDDVRIIQSEPNPGPKEDTSSACTYDLSLPITACHLDDAGGVEIKYKDYL